jgi:hypothetical protein
MSPARGAGLVRQPLASGGSRTRRWADRTKRSGESYGRPTTTSADD